METKSGISEKSNLQLKKLKVRKLCGFSPNKSVLKVVTNWQIVLHPSQLLKRRSYWNIMRNNMTYPCHPVSIKFHLILTDFTPNFTLFGFKTPYIKSHQVACCKLHLLGSIFLPHPVYLIALFINKNR